MNRNISAIIAASVLMGCSDVRAQNAWFTYDLRGENRRLHAYPIEQSDWVPKPAKLANGAEIAPAARAPKLPYYCVWRDIGQSAMFSATKPKAPPSKIFLVCIFGASQWSPPPPDRLLELSNERAKHEESVIRMVWEKRGAEYIATRFEVQIHNPAQFEFRSQNFSSAQMANVKIEVHAMTIPVSPDSPFSFDVSVSAPGKEVIVTKSPTREHRAQSVVSLSLKGTATPHPPWLVY